MTIPIGSAASKLDLPFLSAKLNSADVAVTTLVDGTGVLVNFEGMEVLTFNETGILIVNKLREEATTLEGLVNAITAEFEVDDATARQDVEVFLTRLWGGIATRHSQHNN